MSSETASANLSAVVTDNRLGASLEIEPLFVRPITHKYTAARLLQESQEDLTPFFGRGSEDGAIKRSLEGVPSSPERAACIAPNAEKFDNQKPRAASFLFMRRGTQSYDEFTTAVPLRPRLSMMLGMVNTSDIFWIGEHASACSSSGRRVT